MGTHESLSSILIGFGIGQPIFPLLCRHGLYLCLGESNVCLILNKNDMSNKKAQGFRFSCLFSPFSLTNQDTFTLENILKKYIFPSSKHELGAGTAVFSWCTPARYYGMMCFLKECFKILYSLRASQLRPLPCWQSVFSRPCSLAP